MIQDIEIQADINNEYNTIMAIASKRDITEEEYRRLLAYDFTLCVDFYPKYGVAATTSTPVNEGGDFVSILEGYFSLEFEAKSQAKHDAKTQALESGLVDWHDKY